MTDLLRTFPSIRKAANMALDNAVVLKTLTLASLIVMLVAVLKMAQKHTSVVRKDTILSLYVKAVKR